MPPLSKPMFKKVLRSVRLRLPCICTYKHVAYDTIQAQLVVVVAPWLLGFLFFLLVEWDGSPFAQPRSNLSPSPPFPAGKGS
jgi:hypothetical protein